MPQSKPTTTSTALTATAPADKEQRKVLKALSSSESLQTHAYAIHIVCMDERHPQVTCLICTYHKIAEELSWLDDGSMSTGFKMLERKIEEVSQVS